MDDQLQQVGTSIAANYYGLLDYCLEGAMDAFFLPDEAKQLAQMEQDMELFSSLESKFMALETQFNAGFTTVKIEQQVVPEQEPTDIAFEPSFLPLSKAKVHPTNPSGIKNPRTAEMESMDKSLPIISKDILTENINTNPKIDAPIFFDKKGSQPDLFKNDGPSINPLDNVVKTNQTVGPTLPGDKQEKEPFQETRKNKLGFPSESTQPEEKARKAGPLGSLTDFAKHFEAAQTPEPTFKDSSESTLEQEALEAQKKSEIQKQQAPQTKPPKNLKSFADFISNQPLARDAIPLHSPPLARDSVRTPPLARDSVPQRTPPKTNNPIPAKINQRETTLKNEEEISEFKTALTSNPTFVKQFLSTDNKPLPADVDYDELIEKLAKHLYWEYKRYYGK